MVYFGRETAWKPAEGQVPGPDTRQIIDADDVDEEDESSGVMLDA